MADLGDPRGGQREEQRGALCGASSAPDRAGGRRVREEVRQGALFYDPARARGGSAGNPIYKKVGERPAAWLRKNGIDDPNIKPNHAWRHRFKTVSRRVEMDAGGRDYLQGHAPRTEGHAPRTEGEAYGEFEPPTLLRDIGKLPRIEV